MTLIDSNSPAPEDDRARAQREYDEAKVEKARWQKAYDESLRGLEPAVKRFTAKWKILRSLMSRAELAEMDAAEKAAQ